MSADSKKKRYSTEFKKNMKEYTRYKELYPENTTVRGGLFFSARNTSSPLVILIFENFLKSEHKYVFIYKNNDINSYCVHDTRRLNPDLYTLISDIKKP